MDTQQATAECTTAPLRPFDLLPNELLLDILAHVVDAVGRIHLSTADTMTNRACHFARFQVRQMLRLVSRRWRDTVGLEETAAYLTWRNREALLAPRPGRLPVAVQLKQLHASPWTTLKDPRRTWQNIGEVVERVPALEELLLDVDGLVEAWRAVESQSHIGNNLRKLKKLSTRSDLPYRMLQPLFVGPSDLRVLELKTVADIPLTLPAFNLPHLRRLTWNAMRSPVASLPRTLDLLRNLLGTPSLHHCNVVLPTYPNESTDLAAVLAEAAPRLHSLSLAAISDETKPLRYNVSGALPLMVSLRSLHLSAAFLAANTSSQFAFLRSQPRLHALRIHWDHKRARDDGEWSWLQLATGLKESSVMRRQKLVVTVGISGPLRAYDIAQRASKTAMMDAGVENVELWLEYWNEPFRAY